MGYAARHFDLLSAFVGMILIPVVYFAFRLSAAHLKDGVRFVIDGLVYNSARLLKHRLAWGLTLRRYCRLQMENYQYFFVPSSIETKVPLDTVFVTLRLESQSPAPRSVSQGEIFSIDRKLIVIGEPGSGKSSLIKWLFRDACRKGQKSAKGRLPVLLELKELQPPVKQSRDWLYRELSRQVARSNVYQIEECFESYAQTAGILVLLDGLDEVSTKQYPRIEQSIRDLIKELSFHGENNAVIMTMRSQFYQQVKDAYRDSFGPTLRMEPFRPADIYEFLSKWPFGSNGQHMPTQIYKDLTDRPTLRDLCSNPLVLSMYVAEIQRSASTISPESRTEFYARVTDELVIRRRLSQKRGSAVAPAKLREQRQRILGALSLQHLLDPSQPANSLKWSDALRITREVVGCSQIKAVELMREIEKETGVIEEERVDETLKFIHLTFCEYFAAFEAIEGQEDGWGLLLSAHRTFSVDTEGHAKSRLGEVLPFASGLLKRKDRAAAISDLLGIGDQSLLARSFLETKLYEHPAWVQFVQSEERALIETPEVEWNEDWLQRLYLFNVVVLDSRLSSEHIAKIEEPVLLDDFFRQLVSNQVESLGKLLRAYAIQDAAAVFRLAEVSGVDLAQQYPEIVITSCDQEAFFGLVVEQAKAGRERSDSWLSLLVEAGLRYRIVAEWLMSENVSADLGARLGKISSLKRWPFEFSEKNLFTQCIAIAMDVRSFTDLSLLPLIQDAEPAPKKIWHSCARAASMFAMLCFILLQLFIVLSTDPFGPYSRDAFLVRISIFTMVLAYFFGVLMLWFKNCRDLYEVMLNQKSAPKKWIWFAPKKMKLSLKRVEKGRKIFSRPEPS